MYCKLVKKNFLVILLAGCAIMILAYVLMASRKKVNDVSNNPPITNPDYSATGNPSETLLAGPNAIYAADQKPGNTVVISTIALERPSFVIIRRLGSDGKVMEILGSSGLLDENDITAAVDLSNAVSEGNRLVAILYEDNGDGVFTDEDETATDSNGNSIQAQFMITETPEQVEASL